MSRVQLALNVADLEESVAFYTKVFGVQPHKRRPGYVNFEIAEPPLDMDDRPVAPRASAATPSRTRSGSTTPTARRGRSTRSPTTTPMRCR